MKILYVYSDVNCSCTRKNTFEIQKGFESIGNPVQNIFYTNLTEDHFKEYDCLVFQRLGGNGGFISDSYFKVVKNLVIKYKESTLTVYNIDDLLDRKYVYKFMAIVDLILVANKNFKKYYGRYNANFKYYNTFVDTKRISNIDPIKSEKFTILWGSTGLMGRKFMVTLLPEILRVFKNDTVKIIGGNSSIFAGYKSAHKNLILYNIQPYDKLVAHIKSADVLLNPISIDVVERGIIDPKDFIHCKAEVKYVNAGICRTPIISSKSYQYLKAIQNNHNGFILDNNISEWINTISNVKNNRMNIKKIIKNAYKDVSENYSLEKVSSEILEIFKKSYTDLYKIKKTYPKKYREVNQKLEDLKSASQIPLLKSDFNLNLDQENTNASGVLGEFFNKRKIFQKIVCLNNGFCRIDLRGATYMHSDIKGRFIISLQNTIDGEVVKYFEKSIELKNLEDNAWFTVDFKPLEKSKNKTYYIKIEGDGCEVGNSVSLYFSKDVLHNQNLYTHKKVFNGSLVFKTYYK